VKLFNVSILTVQYGGCNPLVRIIITSDLHIDASYTYLTGQKLDERRSDFLTSLDAILEITGQQKADVLLIAGDFFDKVNPSNEARFHAMRSLKNFTKMTKTKIFIVSGNHDAPKSSSSSRTPLDTLGLLDNVVVETSGDEFKHYRTSGSGKSIGIYMKGYDGLHGNANPLSSLPKGSDDINIALLHGSLNLAKSCYSDYKDYAPFNADDCNGKGFDCFALGHLHEPQHYATEHGIFMYPGCPQRYSFKEADGKKGVYLLDTDKVLDEDTIQFLPIPCRELAITEVKLDKSMDDLNQVILDAIKNDDQNALLNILLTGTVLFDAYKKLKISELIGELNEYWFAVKVDKEFQVYDPYSEFEFKDLSAIGPKEEFKKAISKKLAVAKKEKNEVLVEKYKWMLDVGMKMLTKIQEGGE